MRVVSSTTRQINSDEVFEVIENILSGEKTAPISDSVAVSIAAWWQSPDWNGRAFAELASTGSVELDRLCDNIADAIKLAENDLDRFALMALFSWATVNAR